MTGTQIGPSDSAFIRATRGLPVPHTPVWYMRQAGRSLPEYRALRQGVGMLESCMTPDLVVEITMQPVRRYGVDAAIFFSDIVLPLKAVGVDLDIKPGVGPVVASPVRTLEDVAAIPDLTPEHVPFITESVQRLVGELGGTPLIGFAGAPFTVASYLVEGGPSKEHARTKAMMFGAPDVWAALMDKIAGIAAAYLSVQVAAGASAVQLFDSWAGACTPEDYAEHVMPYSARVLAAAGELGVPRIHFGVNTGSLLPLMASAGADVVGVDWRTPLSAAIPLVGERAVQGNLDPTLVFAPTSVMTARAAEIVEAGRAAHGHIFNLGHGVIPDTDPGQLEELTRFVQSIRDIMAIESELSNRQAALDSLTQQQTYLKDQTSLATIKVS
ncbi:MAG: uroporphyrinogen decarboxylase, partial [Nocardioides sp.]